MGLSEHHGTDYRARHHCRDRSECDMGDNAGADSISQRGDHVQHHSHHNYGGYRELHVVINNVLRKEGAAAPSFFDCWLIV